MSDADDELRNLLAADAEVVAYALPTSTTAGPIVV